MILVSCYTHGVQRHNLEGKSEGAYHLGGSASQAVPDFSGRIIAVATLEGELAILSGTGNVRWRTTLPHPALFLETDALGRFVVHGQETGEIARLDLQPAGGNARPQHARPAPGARASQPPQARGRPRSGRPPGPWTWWRTRIRPRSPSSRWPTTRLGSAS